MNPSALRQHVLTLLDGGRAHMRAREVLAGFPARQRGARPPGFQHSAWQLLEHLRLAQADILEFCVAARYHEKKWPDEFWPKKPAPPNAAAWTKAIAGFRRDRKTLQRLAGNPRIDLEAIVPHGTTQTYLRELLLIADHNAYHIGQLVALRKALGSWS